jgi:two-component system CheB/CheR fusion protein
MTTQLSPQRVERFFIKHESTYEVRKPLRDMIVFARHNVITDPPFSRMDLICCRNMLIYIEPETQRKILVLLFYLLSPAITAFCHNLSGASSSRRSCHGATLRVA